MFGSFFQDLILKPKIGIDLYNFLSLKFKYNEKDEEQSLASKIKYINSIIYWSLIKGQLIYDYIQSASKISLK